MNCSESNEIQQIVTCLIEFLLEKHGKCNTARVCSLEVLENPNSKICRVGIRVEKHTKVYYIKQLYPNDTDGRTGRSDLHFKKSQLQKEFEALQSASRVFAPYPDLAVIKPVTYFPEYLALVSEESQGTKVSDLLNNLKFYSPRSRVNEMFKIVRLCGKWLRLLHDNMTVDQSDGEGIRAIPNYCDIRLKILKRYRPSEFHEKFCSKIMDYLNFLFRQVSKSKEFQIVGCHNDFSFYNMLFSEGRLIVLDFGGYGPAHPHSDYVRFWSGIDKFRVNPLFPPWRVEALKEQFIEAYGKMFDLQEPLFKLYRLPYVLDQMGDFAMDWNLIPAFKRPLYSRLYRHYFQWVKETIES